VRSNKQIRSATDPPESNLDGIFRGDRVEIGLRKWRPPRGQKRRPRPARGWSALPDGEVPDHSTFSKNRHGRFRDCDLLRKLLERGQALLAPIINMKHRRIEA
jgi:hypothetical protein